MATWRDSLGPASFRGVPFYVDVSERTGGRRVVKHDYPFRDQPFVEDMGRKARTFPIEGFVLGDSYLMARDALLDALEQEGSGELVHPYYGTRRVIPLEFRVREGRDVGGGVAKFAIEFGETDAQSLQPTAIPDAVAKAKTSADAARSAAGDAFLARYKVARQPQWAMAALSGVVQSASAALSSAILPVTDDLQRLASAKRTLDGLTANALTLVRAPADLVGTLVGFFETMDSVPLTRAVLNSVLRAYGFSPGIRPTGHTPARVQQGLNFDALQQYLQTLAAVQAARLALDLTYDSYEDALAARDEILTVLDEQTAKAGDEYTSLAQLRADLALAVPGADGDLPRLLKYMPPLTLPSLVLAHRLYGDVSMEADLLARNKVQHPGFVLGGRDLEVLSDGT